MYENYRLWNKVRGLLIRQVLIKRSCVIKIKREYSVMRRANNRNLFWRNPGLLSQFEWQTRANLTDETMRSMRPTCRLLNSGIESCELCALHESRECEVLSTTREYSSLCIRLFKNVDSPWLTLHCKILHPGSVLIVVTWELLMLHVI